MNEDADDIIDAVLRDHFDGPVPDNGFSNSVIDRLSRRKSRFRWPMTLGILAGVVLCYISLSMAPLVQAGLQDWSSGDTSEATVVLFIMAAAMGFLALAWTLAEADDHLNSGLFLVGTD